MGNEEKRKFLAILLTVCLIVGALPLNVYAAQVDFSNHGEICTDENLGFLPKIY